MADQYAYKAAGSVPVTGSISGGMSASTGGSIAMAAVSAWNTYQLGTIAADLTKHLSEVQNKRTAIQQGLQMWNLNEQASEARRAMTNQKMDAQVVAMQKKGQLTVQQAFSGQRGQTADRMQLAGDIEASRVQEAIGDQGYTQERQLALQEAQLRMNATNALVATAESRPDAALTGLSFATDMLRIGSDMTNIKGG